LMAAPIQKAISGRERQDPRLCHIVLWIPHQLHVWLNALRSYLL
jgi:hypothetical protein